MNSLESCKKLNILPHSLSLKNRSFLQISGITDIENFNDQTVTAYTQQESLLITGENLHIKKLNLEQGELCLTGKIFALTYRGKGKSAKSKKSFFEKIFK